MPCGFVRTAGTNSKRANTGVRGGKRSRNGSGAPHANPFNAKRNRLSTGTSGCFSLQVNIDGEGVPEKKDGKALKKELGGGRRRGEISPRKKGIIGSDDLCGWARRGKKNVIPRAPDLQGMPF